MPWLGGGHPSGTTMNKAIFLGLGLALGAAVQAQNFVTNGDFESPVVDPGLPYGNIYTAGNTFAGWTVDAGSQSVEQAIPANGYGSPHSGSQFLFLPYDYPETFASLSQPITGLTPGMTYQVVCWTSMWTDTSAFAKSTFTLSVGGVSVGVAYDGTAITALHGPQTPGVNSEWKPLGFSFTTADTDTILKIEGSRDLDGSFVAVDDISITLVAVPEPAAYAAAAGLMLLGLGVVARGRR